jgi:hypothetical protein
VPAYDPWTVYGQPLAPYPGFSLLGALGSFVGSALNSGLGSGLGASPISFGLGIAMAAFTHMSWGWLGWGLNWLAQTILFHQSNYFPQSSLVSDWGLPHGGPRAFARGGGAGYRGDRSGYGGAYGRTAERFNQQRAYAGREGYNSREGYAGREGYGASPGRGGYNPQAFARTSAYPGNRPGEAYRPQPGTYGSGFNGRPSDSYGNRPGTAYSGSMQAYRGPAPTFGRNDAGPAPPAASSTAAIPTTPAGSSARTASAAAKHQKASAEANLRRALAGARASAAVVAMAAVTAAVTAAAVMAEGNTTEEAGLAEPPRRAAL